MKSQQDIAQKAGGWVGAAYCICVLAAFPLYMHYFIDQGLTKFSGYLTLTVLWLPLLAACLLLRICTIYDAKPLAAWRDPELLWPLAFLVTTLVSTALSLDPNASLWGLNSYYGGCMLVVCGTLGFLVARFWARRADAELVLRIFLCAAMVVTILDLINLLNMDPLGAYTGMAERERRQFYSTIGQMDFVASFLSLALPMGVYRFLTAQTRSEMAFYGPAAFVLMLSPACVTADSLLLGALAFGAALFCLPGFDTVWLRRGALCVAAFFGWDLALWAARKAGVHFNIAMDLLTWKFSEPIIAVPAILLCVLLWAVLFCRRGRPPVALYRQGRILVAVCAAALVLAIVSANLGVRFPDELQKLLYFDENWGTMRGQVWMSTWDAFWHSNPLRLLVGYGPGMTHTRLALWMGSDMNDFLATFYAAHNEYLDQMLCCGLLGLVAWVGFIVTRLRRGFKAAADPLTAAVTLGLLAQLVQAGVNIRVSMVFPEVLILLGLLDMLTRVPEPETKVEPQPETPARKGKRPPKQQPTRQYGPLRKVSIVVAAFVTMPFWWGASHVICAFLWG